MLRYVHRTGVGVVAWRQASGAALATTCAPRDNHRRVVSRGRLVRGAVGYGISGVGSSTGNLAAIALTAATGSAASSGGGVGSATGALSSIALTAATGSGSTVGPAFATGLLAGVTLYAANAYAYSNQYVAGARAGGSGSRNTSRPARIATTTR